MLQPVVIIGLGEVGELFAQGFLLCGHPVYPILRVNDPAEAAERVPDPALVLVAVGENDLYGVLKAMPTGWRDRLTLLQNELLPRDWEQHGIADPTVVVVWFDKKKGRPFSALLPSIVCGTRCGPLAGALEKLQVPYRVIGVDDRLYELARKNLYILTINLAGILTGGTVEELWQGHRQLVTDVANEILDLQEHATRTRLPRERLMAALFESFAADPRHSCTGRSARERLQRTLLQARAAGIRIPVLDRIATAELVRTP